MKGKRIFFILMSFLLVSSAFFAMGVSGAAAQDRSIVKEMASVSASQSGETVLRHEFLALLIRETGLNLDGIYFFKAPDVRDVAPDVTPEARYAGDLIVAGHYGVVKNGVPFRPDEPILREEAASMVVKALFASLGPLPLTEQLILFEDQDRINQENRSEVQDACKLGLFSYNNKFRPEAALSRGEYSSLVTALQKIYKDGDNAQGVTWKLSDNQRKITLYWGEKPTGGYRINIDSVESVGDVLRVYYSLQAPGPTDIVTQARTYPRVETDLPEHIGSFGKVQLIKRGIVFTIGRNHFYLDSQKVNMDAVPFIENGRAMIPARYLAVALGILEEGIVWSPSAASLTLSKGDVTVTLAPGGNMLTINNKPEKMDAVPILQEGRLYLPARFLAKAFGFHVGWDADYKTVFIGTNSR